MLPEYPSDAYANALNRLRVPQFDMACQRLYVWTYCVESGVVPRQTK